MNAPSTATLLTRKQIALRLQISVATLDRWIDDGKFPRPKYHGEHSPRWSAAVVEEWERGGKKGR
jgi:prophage regulatory protein